MNQRALGDVVLATQVQPPHSAGIVKVGKTWPGRESPSAGCRRGGAPEPAPDWSPPRSKSASDSACPMPDPIIGPKHSHLKMFRRLYPRAAGPYRRTRFQSRFGKARRPVEEARARGHSEWMHGEEGARRALPIVIGAGVPALLVDVILSRCR